MDCIEQTYIQGLASKSWIRLLVLSACLMGLSHLHAASGSDNADNYSTWSSGDNQGTGFGPWNLVQVNGGWFLGDPSSRASNLSSLVTSGKTFGLWSSDVVALATRYAKATRAFSTPLVTNDRFKISLGYQWDNGARGFNLLNGTIEVFNFNINSVGLSWTGGGSYAAIPWGGKRENGVRVDIAIIKTATGLRFTITSPEDSNLNGAGSVVAAGATGFDVYVSEAGGGSGASDFNFNNLVLDSVPGDVTPPDMTINGDKLVQVAVGETYTPPDPAVAVSDDVTTSANIVVTTSPLDSSTAGLKTITYTAKDEANNDATVTRVVLVGDLTATTADTYYNLHSPATLTLNPTSSTSVYGQIYLKGATPGVGQTPNIQAWIGVNSDNTDPSTWSDTTWKSAAYNSGQTGNNDEYSAQLTGADYTTGNTYYYATRWKVGSGAYAYGGTTGPWNGTTSVNGILTVVPVREVTFAVDMGVQAFRGAFTSGTDSDYLMGDVSDWTTGVVMIQEGETSIYKATLNLGGAENTTRNYKFRSSAGGFEGDLDPSIPGDTTRVLTLGAANVTQSLTTATFNNQSEARKVTVRVDMSIQQQAGNFNPSTGTVKVGGNFNGWTAASLVAQGNGIYAGEFLVEVPLSAVEYKFMNGVTYESISNRTITVALPNLAASTLDPVYFNNHDVAVADSTFAGAYPGKSMTDVAPNGLTYLANYAFGGDSNTQPILPVQDMSDPDKLQLIVVYRTDDPTLPLSGLRGEATTDLSGAWDLPDVGVTNGDRTGLPDNLTRKVISVDRGTASKKFLRATVTK